MLKPKTILVPTDFSPYSDKAFRQALDIAGQFDSTVILLHVVSDDVLQCSLEYCLNADVYETLRKEMLARAEEKLASELARFPESQNVRVVTRIGHGKAYQAILQEAREQNADLIVLASLGKSGIAHVLIGGVARHILQQAVCPVLLTR